MVDINGIDEKIKEYYLKEAKIKQLKNKLNSLFARKEKLEKSLANTTAINFQESDYSLRAVNYDNVGGKTINISTMSPQDRTIEKTFKNCEVRLLNIANEIIIVEDEIDYLRQENSEIDYIINGLKLEYKKIIEGFYKYNKSIVQLTLELNMDKATIYRKKNKSLEDIQRWLQFNEIGYC